MTRIRQTIRQCHEYAILGRVPRLKGTSRVNDYSFITQKDTQFSQTYSEGYTILLLYASVAFLRIWGVLLRLD